MKKALSLMKKRNKGFIKIWKSRAKNMPTFRQVWSNGEVMVIDGFNEDFNLEPGSYIYDPTTGLIKPAEIPDLLSVIPKLKGYHKAEAVRDNDYLVLLKDTKTGWNQVKNPLVTLKGNGVKAYVDFTYYQYLLGCVLGESIWKVKDGESVVLVYDPERKAVRAVVMPVKLN